MSLSRWQKLSVARIPNAVVLLAASPYPHLSLVPWHLSLGTYHLSLVTCHLSLVTCHLSLILTPFYLLSTYTPASPLRRTSAAGPILRSRAGRLGPPSPRRCATSSGAPARRTR